MRYVSIEAFDCPDAWYKALNTIWHQGDVYDVAYGSEPSSTRKLNLSIEIEHPENRPLIADKAPTDMKYVNFYALKYLWSGVIEDETYTYGSRLREPIDQVDYAIRRIIEEPRDRQITMVIRLPEDIKKQLKDQKHEPPCLSLMDIEVMDNKLHLTCYFRSWDAYAGLPSNIAGIQIFNEAMVSEINARGGLNLQTGKLVFHSKNCHIYERLYENIKELISPGEDQRRKFLAERKTDN